MLILFDLMWFLLIVIAAVFFLFGLDGVFLDLYYMGYSLFRAIKKRKYPPLTYEQLANCPEKKIAIIVPCWQEANVIGDMLRHNVRAIDYRNYTLFVGVYANDPETVAVVQEAEKTFSSVCCVIGSNPGPTTKADNLNAMYAYILAQEAKLPERYEIIVLHDSEDMIHPLSLKLYNYLIPRKEMVQIPIFPLAVNYFNFTHWIYNDEFAEYHTKDIIVREAIRGLVPSAGVGTAFARRAIERLTEDNPGKLPFALGHLTEDYNTSLKIRLANFKAIFLTQKIWRKQYQRNSFSSRLYLRKVKEYVATRALFPTEYTKAVRQKARWIIGIAIQEWLETGWKGDFSTRYCLLTDRKSLFTHLVNGLGYVVFLFWVFYAWWQFYHPAYPSLQDQFNHWPLVWYLILGCTIIMVDRLIQRMIATWRVYGIIPALLSVPRTFYANILNLHAVLRAYHLFFFNPVNKKQPKWEKTEHIFAPSPILRSSDKKLGNYLVEEGYLSEPECVQILSEQLQTGERMGDLLIQKGILSQDQLYQLLAKQYNLQYLPKLPAILPREQLSGVSAKDYQWMLENQFFPIQLLAEDPELLLAIVDPANTAGMERVEKILAGYQVRCVLVKNT